MFWKKKLANISMRDTLFGDMPLDNWLGGKSIEVPWNLFKAAKQFVDKSKKDEAISALQQIITAPGLESRHYLQAYYSLAKLGVLPEGDVKTFGLVVEVAMEQGLDLLAVYADHSARYYNYSGGAIIWDVPDKEIGEKIDRILLEAKTIVLKIGPWKEARPPAPINGMARVNFLTSHGLHFGEAQQQVLFKDPLASNIMYAMLNMMETLISKTKKA